MDHGHIITIGTFDGVHAGHRAILSMARQRAQELNLDSTAFTFLRPPRSYATDAPRRILLLPPQVKRKLLERYVDRIVDAEFSEVRDLSPAAFFREILVARLHAREVVVGEGFRFGHRREGTAETLRSLGNKHSVSVHLVPRVFADGEPASSTRIRAHLRRGEIEPASHLLGRPPLLFGTVAEGDRIGRDMGFPTANLTVHPDVLLPSDGIYFVQAFFPGQRFHGLLYVGRRPTFESRELRCEVHLLSEPEQTLYGKVAEVHLLGRLREDRAFDSAEALARQIAEDVDHAREWMNRFPLVGSAIVS